MLYIEVMSYLWHNMPDNSEGLRAATELEALAVVASIEHFAHYLYGREFRVITDHRALESLQTS